jgi:hypothetical protein
VSPVDAIIAAAILAGALWLLWRSLLRNPGRCAGCSSGACRPTRETSLVSLGTNRPPAAAPPPGRR